MKYKYLLFDADNTLFDFDKCEKQAFLSLAEYLPDTFTEDNFAVYRSVNTELWLEAEKGYISKSDLKIERFRRFFDIVKCCADTPYVDYIANEYLKRLGRGTFLIDGAEELLKYLYDKYDIYVITNGIASVQRERFSRSTISGYIKNIFISEEIGYDKPNVHYFENVMTKINCDDVSEYLIIGDSLSSDIKGAENVGIDSVYFSRNNPMVPAESAKYNINSLKELKTFL